MTIGYATAITSLAKLEGEKANEALHLRAMRQANQGFTFYQKTQNLCEMHKNRQNSVDIISKSPLHGGMATTKNQEALRTNTYIEIVDYSGPPNANGRIHVQVSVWDAEEMTDLYDVRDCYTVESMNRVLGEFTSKYGLAKRVDCITAEA